MDDQCQDVNVGVEFEQLESDGKVAGHIEPGPDEPGQVSRHLLWCHGNRVKVEQCSLGREHVLDRLALVHRVEGSERLVTGNDVGQRLMQGGDVQASAETKCDRDVVCGGCGVVLIEEPHAFLRRRHRNPFRSDRDLEGGASTHARLLSHRRLGQHAGCGGVEECSDTDVGVQRIVDAGHGSGGAERVATGVEEVVVDAEAPGFDDRRQDAGDGFFEGCRRWRSVRRRGGAGSCGDGAGFEGGPVEFAGRGARDRLDRHDRCRNHVVGKLFGEMGDQARWVDLPIGGGQYVRRQRRVTGGGGAGESGGEGHGGVAGERGVDLTEFDAETADLHLEVAPAEVFERMGVRRPPHHVTGPVHPFARFAVRVGDETRSGEPGPPMVATRETVAGDVKFAGDTDRDRLQQAVEYEFGDTTEGATDRHRPRRVQVRGHIRRHGGLGRTVGDEKPVPGRPPLHQRGRTLLPAGQDTTDVRDVPRVDRSECGGSEKCVGDLLFRHDPAEFLPAVYGWRHDHHRRSHPERQQVFQNGGVEARRREVQHPGPGGHPRAVAQLLRQRVQPAVRDEYTFRHTGGTRGVDGVGEAVDTRRQAGHTVRARIPVLPDLVEVDPEDGVR
ncbi:hypothetical protein MLGJGCBP_03112 [Rhodococcus sp. T7]|nr:hypothetical protein MLGJGCBP_03112 [Rhodococcus sp. T7]